MIHCTARNNIAHYFFDKIKEGGVYLLKGFTVQRTDQYRILKDSPFVIWLNGSTTVKRVDDTSGSFTRYPFLLTAFEDLEPTEGKYFVGMFTLLMLVILLFTFFMFKNRLIKVRLLIGY